MTSKSLMAASTPRTAATSALVPRAGHYQPTPPPETLKHSQAGLAQSSVGSLLLFPGSWCTQGFVYALPESVSPSPVEVL